MREIPSCFSEYAVKISDSASSTNSCIPAATSSVPSIQQAVTAVYRTVLSTQKQILITLSWRDSSSTHSLSISFGDDCSAAFKLIDKNSKLFRKLRGSKSFELPDSKVDIFWDLSAAKYQTGPEPVSGYYILVMVDRELGLILGDKAEEATRSKVIEPTSPKAKSLILSRQEHYSGSMFYSTKARFSDRGAAHDILIRCSGEGDGFKNSVLMVSVDGKTVIRVKRLHWNFRGNQTIFLDGLLVDMMWDVHDWFYNPVLGCGVFMFRTRRGIDNRLWLEEKMVQKDGEKTEFSLTIYGCKKT